MSSDGCSMSTTIEPSGWISKTSGAAASHMPRPVHRLRSTTIFLGTARLRSELKIQVRDPAHEVRTEVRRVRRLEVRDPGEDLVEQRPQHRLRQVAAEAEVYAATPEPTVRVRVPGEVQLARV